MTRTIIFLCMLWSSISIYSQIDFKRDFIVYYNDSIEYPDFIEYKAGLFHQVRITADGKIIDASEIQYFHDFTGIYANTRHIKSLKRPGFAKRISDGNINLFSEKVIVGSGFNSGGSRSTMDLYYYNKGMHELKKATYKNLLIDVADNEESMQHLNKLKKSMNVTRTFCVIGGTSLLYGFGSLGYHIHMDNNYSGSFEIIPMAIGAICIIAPLLFSPPKDRYILDAIRSYNY